MSAGAIALLAGAGLAVGALAFVLYPLFFDTRRSTRRADPSTGSPSESAIVALREIEFDRATGKLSESDYTELRAMYATRALAELRAADGAPPQAAAVDPLEARVRAYRAVRKECGTCGLRPEPDAIYCSSCGTYLDGRCPSCQTPVSEPAAAYCSTCGVTLADGRSGATV